jgi:hypothetical protein
LGALLHTLSLGLLLPLSLLGSCLSLRRPSCPSRIYILNVAFNIFAAVFSIIIVVILHFVLHKI